MMLAKTAQQVVCRPSSATSRPQAVFQPRVFRVLRRAQSPQNDDADGFVGQDNSGKSNIFPNINKPFVSSPASEAIASQGLGGAQGGAIVGASIVVILALAVLVGQVGTGETLDQIQASATQESLTEIARRLGGSSGF